jgi:predicted deacylase
VNAPPWTASLAAAQHSVNHPWQGGRIAIEAAGIHCEIALSGPGKRIGALRVTHSDDAHAFGHVRVPVALIEGGPGRTVLLVAGNHGDEYEGQAIALGLLHALQPAELAGRLVILPALNAPAVAAARRTSPLDQVNMNRAFLGGASTGPSAAIARWVEALLPQCACVIDLHSGGRTAEYADAALVTHVADARLWASHVALARAAGLPVVQVLGATSSATSLNSAAAAASVPCLAMELGGGARTSRTSLEAGRAATLRLLGHLGLLPAGPPLGAASRWVELAGTDAAVVVPADGVIEPLVGAGAMVRRGQDVAVLHHWREPHRPPATLHARLDGLVLAIAARGKLEPGDHAALIASCIEEPRPA